MTTQTPPVLQAHLTRVDLESPAPQADAEFLARVLGFRRVDGTDLVLRTCADPYGCSLVLQSGPVTRVAGLAWRPGAEAQLPTMVNRVEGSARARGQVLSSGWEGSRFRVQHPGGLRTELHWQLDRTWSGGPALSCPLHRAGSTELCDPEPPLLDAVGLDVPADALEWWAQHLLGLRAGTGPGWRYRSTSPTSPAVAVGGPDAAVLVVRTGRVVAEQAIVTPGGLRLLLQPGEPIEHGDLN